MSSLFVLILLACVVAWFVFKRGENLRFETSASAQEVINVAVATAGTGRRWSTLGVTTQSGTFSYHKKPNALVAIVLLLCFVVPGLVYLVLAGKRESLNVTVTESGTGRQVQVVSNGFRGKLIGRSIQRQAGVTGATRVGDAAQAAVAHNHHQQPQPLVGQSAYRVGDVVDGHRFDGTQWVPVEGM